MPRLAGQPAEYLEIALKQFQDMNPGKRSTPMIGIAATLSEGDIKALAEYLAGR